MALTFPRDEFMEMFFPSLGWVDVTSQVRQTDPVTISRGRSNEQGKVAPSKLTAVMKNESGNFSPSNPMGAYYGQLGRNTPLQYGFGLSRDTFSRTVVDGLGSADTGETWTLDGTAANFDVGSGSATIAISAASTARHAYLASLAAWADYEVTADITVPFPNGTNNSAGLVFRGSTTSDAWRLSLTVASGGGVSLNISDGAGTLMGSIYNVDTVSAGTYRVRVLVENGTVLGKAWPAAGVQPYEWQVQHTATTGLNATGWVGIRARTGTGASNVTFTFDNFTVRLVRFAGELASLQPRWNENHTVKWAALEAAGIMRRLDQGKKPLRTAIERYVVANPTQPIAYWPLDDEGLSLTGRVAAGQGDPAIINFFASAGPTVDFTPGLAFGSGQLAPWLNPVAAIQHKTFTRCGVIEPPTSYTVHCAISFPGGRYADALNSDSLTIGSPLSGTGIWTIRFDSFNEQIEVQRPVDSVTVTTQDVSIFDEAVHHIGWRAKQIGTDTQWALFVDGVMIDSATLVYTNASVTRIVFQQNVTDSDDNRLRSIGHVAIYSGDGPSVTEIYDAISGHPGEAAGRRIERLCAEEDLQFTYVGDLDDTAAMGPQGARTVLDLVQECADADQGTLYESRAVVGLSLRTRTGAENQSVALTLDYSAKQVSDPLEPTHDDQDTLNDVTANRRDGGEARAEKLAGPLNVNNPGTDPDGVGRNDGQITVNVQSDDQLQAIAERMVARGTVAEDRFPRIRVNLRAPAIAGNAAQETALMAVDIDDRMMVQNLSAANIFEPIDQLARGYVETLANKKQHEITFNTAPYKPYQIFVLDTDRLGGDNSTLTSGIAATGVSTFQITTTDGTLWTTAAGDFPMDVWVGGEKITISGISGAASPQTASISARAVNGVSKSHLAGVKIEPVATVVLG